MRRLLTSFTSLFKSTRPTPRTTLALLAAFAILISALSIHGLIVRADNTAQTLPFSQNWTNTGLITANDDWSGVAGIEGFLGDRAASGTTSDIDPQTILEPLTTIDVIANQTNPNTNTAGGVAEFHATLQSTSQQTIALQGSGTADHPNVILYLNTTGQSGINVSYNLRDIDCSMDNAQQQVALQYRVGNTGNFTNLPAGYVSDATSRVNAGAADVANCTQVTPVNVTLPAAADNQPMVQVRIITSNAAGSDEWVGIDDISVTAGGGNMAIIPNCPATLTTTAGMATSGNVSATDADGTVTAASITGITPVNPGTITLDTFLPALSVGGTAMGTLNVGAATPAGSYSVTVTWTNNDAPTPQTATCTIAVTVVAAGNTLIHDIQGTTDTPNFVGETRTIQGIVVGDFQTASGLTGFFVEEEVADWDADPNTSEGIFVADPAAFVNVAVGDRVTVTGTVANTFGLTQINPTAGVVINSTGQTLPTAQMLTLPVAATTDFEKFEGMLAQFTGGQVITDTNNLGRFGEFTISGANRLYQPTNSIDPNDNPASGTTTTGATNAAAVNAQQTANNLSRLIVDDGSNVTNTGGLSPIPFIGAGTNATLRPGDMANGLIGVMNFAFSNYRLEVTAPPTFTTNNPRPMTPPAVGSGNLKIVSFNVENYFVGPFPDPTGRGASNAAEFTRQRDKLISAMMAMNADVIGLIELEKNDGNAAAADLAAALTTAMGGGANTYAAVADLATLVGTDTEIKNGMIYRTSAVTTVGTPLTDTTATAGTYSRDPLTQRFNHTATNQQFFVSVNHFRSRSCSGASGADADQGDGQGCFNARRKGQSTALVNFIANTLAPIDPDVVVIGDLNAYSEEDPLDIFRAAGFKDVLDQFSTAADRYSFIFDQQVGSLEGAFVSSSLMSNLTGAGIWHINADEPDIFDYNTENKPDDRYAATPFRSADHDPVLIGLNFGGGCPTITVTPSTVPSGTAGSAYGPVQFMQTGGATPIAWSVTSNNLPAGLTLNPTTGQLSGTPSVAAGVNVTIRATDSNNCFGEVIVTLQINCPTITISPSSGSPTALTGGTIGQAYSQTFTAAPAGGNYTYSIPAPSIPPGLMFNSSTGVLSGTPTTTGTFSFTVTATGFGTCGGTQNYSLTIGCQTIMVTAPAVNTGTIGVPFNQMVTQSGGVGTTTFTITNALSPLPTGLTLSPSGVLSGTPMQAGLFIVNIKATDSNNCMGDANYSLTINCQSITVTAPTNATGTLGIPFSETFTQSGGIGNITFSLNSPNSHLPNGLTLSPNGVLSGTATESGSFPITVRATDANGCFSTVAYPLVINPPCGTITVSPMVAPNGFVGAAYNATFTAGGGTSPYSFTISAGTQPTGLTLSAGGALTGTPTATGTFNFTVKATDANGCMGTQAYTVVISGSGLQFYPLPAPVRLLDTRSGMGISGCTIGTGALAANATRTQQARTACSMIPANATAVIGNVTVVPTNPGFLTLYPADATQPTVANSNFQAGEITNNFFTVGLATTGMDLGAFKIFASAETHVVIDLTGYYAPPGAGGLFYHPLPTPVRLVETRSAFDGCFKPAQLMGTGNPNADPNLDLPVQGRSPGVPSPCNSIPSDAVVLVGNATTVSPSGGGYLTIYPSDATRPTIASSNYAGSDVINGPFAVKLGADGKFKVYTFATTDLVIDITGYYSASPTDANGAGLLFSPLPKPLRLLETRPNPPSSTFVGCYRPNAPIAGGMAGIRTQQVWGLCSDQPITIPNTTRAIVGNATVVNSTGAGFLTFFPGDVATAPVIATSNYPSPATFGYNRHYYVGLSPADGTFKILTQFTTDLVVDVSGYFEP